MIRLLSFFLFIFLFSCSQKKSSDLYPIQEIQLPDNFINFTFNNIEESFYYNEKSLSYQKEGLRVEVVKNKPNNDLYKSSFEEWILNCNNKINKKIISLFTGLNMQGEKEFTNKKKTGWYSFKTHSSESNLQDSLCR